MEQTSFKQRRIKLGQLIQNGVAIIPANHYKQRSHDTDFPFRQNSNFKYLTGFNEAEACLVIKVTDGQTQSILFTRPKDEIAEMWNGRRLGVEKARELLDMDEAYPTGLLSKTLPELLEGHQRVFVDLFDQELVQKVLLSARPIDGRKKKKVHKPSSLHNLTPIIGKMRLFKGPNEIMAMKKAAHCAEVAHKAAMAFSAPGKSEADVHALMEFLFKKEGANGNAYDSIIAGGVNALILHYTENNMELKDGDLLLIDAGAEVNYYASDVTRTFPVNGTYTGAQKEIYELVLEAQKNAIALSTSGKTLSELHDESTRTLVTGMLDLKIMSGDIDTIIHEGTHRSYFPHGTGHWIGLDVHDNSPYLTDDLEEITLASGMAFTIEPGLYFPLNDTSVPEQYRGIGIRIEDDILIDDKFHQNLSISIPKEIKQVEEICKSDYRDYLA